MTYHIKTRDVSKYCDEYLQHDPGERLVNYINQTPFFIWCINQGSTLSDELLKVLANIFSSLKDEVNEYKQLLEQGLSDRQLSTLQKAMEKAYQASSIQQYTYETIRLVGYTGDSLLNTPLEDVFALKRNVQERNRGIYYDEKNRRRLEINTFTRYALTRYHLVQSKSGDYFIYSSSGYYKKAEVVLLKQLFRKIIDEYDDSMWTLSFESNYIAALVSLVPIHSAVDVGNPNLINFTNGVLDLVTKQLLPHSPEFYTFNQLPYEYLPEEKCPKFHAFLQDIFEKDPERVSLIQQLLGYLFLRETKIQKGFVFLGNGSNGKSVLAEVITQLIGKNNVSTTPLSKLNGTFAMQNINGKLANISTENEMKSSFNTQDFKILTSGDMVEIEMKYKDAFSSHIYAKLIILLNKMMDSDDTSDGYYRRLQIIPFNKTYYELKSGEQPKPRLNYMNPSLIDELINELPGIMNFALEGLDILKSNNYRLTPCKASDVALDEYKRQQNPMEIFVDECIQYSIGNKIKRSEVTNEFESWLNECGIAQCRKLSRHSVLEQFSKELEKRQWQVKLSKIQGEHYFTNLKFHTTEKMQLGYVPTI